MQKLGRNKKAALAAGKRGKTDFCQAHRHSFDMCLESRMGGQKTVFFSFQTVYTLGVLFLRWC